MLHSNPERDLNETGPGRVEGSAGCTSMSSSFFPVTTIVSYLWVFNKWLFIQLTNTDKKFYSFGSETFNFTKRVSVSRFFIFSTLNLDPDGYLLRGDNVLWCPTESNCGRQSQVLSSLPLYWTRVHCEINSIEDSDWTSTSLERLGLRSGLIFRKAERREKRVLRI